MCHNWKNESHLEKWFTVGKMCHNWKNGSQLNKCHNFKNGPHLKIWLKLGKMVNLEKMCHNWENVSQLEKCVTIGKTLSYGRNKLPLSHSAAGELHL